jgi:hypothetical protein
MAICMRCVVLTTYTASSSTFKYLRDKATTYFTVLRTKEGKEIKI